MIKRKKFTQQEILDIVKRCKSKKEFRENFGAAYQQAYRADILEEVCKELKQLKLKYTYEEIEELSLQCTGRREFSKKFPGAYQAAWTQDILDEVCNHMVDGRKTREKKKLSTIEQILEKSLQCRIKSEFIQKFYWEYTSAVRQNLLEQACSHMIPVRSIPQLVLKTILEGLYGVKCKYDDRSTISPYEIDILFKDQKIGFEFDGLYWHDEAKINRKFVNKDILCKQKGIILFTIKEHAKNKKSIVLDVKLQLIEILKTLNIIFNKNITEKDTMSFVVDYEKIIPNINDIKLLCLKYDKLTSFRKENRKWYNFLVRHGLFKFMSHMKKKKGPKDFDINEIKELIKNYTGKRFSKDYPEVFSFLKRKKHQDLIDLSKKRKSWTIEEVKFEISKYEYYADFEANSKCCYQAVLKRGWKYLLEENLKRRKPKAKYKKGEAPSAYKRKTNNIFWTEEKILNCVKQCKTYGEFTEKFINAYNAAIRLKCLHLLNTLEGQKMKWTVEKLTSCISECTTLEELIIKHPKAYKTAANSYSYLLKDLKRNASQKRYNENELIEIVSKCSSIAELRINHPAVYRKVRISKKLKYLLKTLKKGIRIKK